MFSISELNKQLQQLPPKKIAEICIRISKHKKENKELLDYILNDSDDEESFREKIKSDVGYLFDDMNKSNLYIAKKSLRKILRMINKYCRFSGNKETEAILLIHFCRNLMASDIQYYNSPVLINLLANQVKKIKSTILKLHEDLQFDLNKELEEILNEQS